MNKSFINKFQGFSSPGDILQEALEERGMSSADLALQTGLSKQYIDQLLDARVILSLDVALCLECALDIPASLWQNLEFNYRTENKLMEET